MVLTPAPEASRQETERPTYASWTNRFQSQGTHRARRKHIPLTWMMVVCTVFPVSLWSRSEVTGVAAEMSQPAPQTEATTAVPVEESAATTAVETTGQASASVASEATTQPAANPSVSSGAPVAPTAPSVAAVPQKAKPAPANRLFAIRAIVSGKTI